MIDPRNSDARTSRQQRLFTHTLFACVSLTAVMLTTASASAAPAPKVEVCHIPPGNPDNFHTITISENALAAHLAHGDIAGPCNSICAVLCDDGNECTIDDTGDCEDNGCPVDRMPVDCNDGDQCTADACDPVQGCVNTVLTGTACDDGAFCTENDVCGADGCEGTPIENCCIADSDCNPTNCNPRFCFGNECQDDEVVCDQAPFCEGGACDETTGACVYTPLVCPESADRCSVSVCSPETGGVCGEVPLECDDGNACTTDACHSLFGCNYTQLNCDDGDPCTADSCDPTTGCGHVPIPDCGATCVNALDYLGSGDTAAPVEACQQNGNCIDPRQCSRVSSSDVFNCVVRGDRVACEAVNNFWQSLGGCSICSPEEPGPSACPCWDGGPQSVPGVSNLTELWQTYGPNTCVTADDCRDYASPDGVVLSSGADCYSSSNDMYTRALSNTIQGLANCTVYVRDPAVNLQLVFPIGSPEAEACLAEHDAFTLTTEFPPVPPGGADADTMCGLGSL